MQCKDSETVSFWNKIHNIKKEDLEYFNSSTTANTFTSDESDYEAFYVFKLFEKISTKVLVKVRVDFIEPIIRNTKKKRRDVNSPLLKNERVVIIALS